MAQKGSGKRRQAPAYSSDAMAIRYMAGLALIALGVLLLFYAVLKAVLFGMDVTILIVAAAIIKFIGLMQAGKDERYFRYAVFVVFAYIIAYLIMYFLTTKGTTIYALLEMFVDIFEILVTVFVVYGIITLAAELGDEKGVYTGKRVINIMVSIYLIMIIT